MTYKGIDVSNVPDGQRNITVNDWKKIKNAGYSFVILKAGGSDDGYYKDAVFEKNYKNAKSAGLNVGAYYIVGSDCKNSAEGERTAKKFIDILNGKKFEYPVYMDVEHPESATRKGNTDAAVAFCQTMQKAGYWVGIYASTESGFESKLDDSRLQSYAHWVADYRGKCYYKGKVGIGIWQYSDRGTVPGISGNVDMDLGYVDYPTKIKAKGLNGFTLPVDIVRANTVTMAASYLGCVRGDSRHKQIVDIFNTVKPDGWAMNYTAAWCATFVSAIFIKMFGKEKAQKYFPLSANCAGIIKGAKARDIWVENDAFVPSPGDLIIYDWSDSGKGDAKGYDHVGIVKMVSKGKITVIEGNRNNKCATRVIDVNGRYISGFVHPNYAKLANVQTTSTTVKTPTVTKLDVDGDWSVKTTNRLQEKLGIEPDGEISNQLNRCKKYLPACNTKSWKFYNNPKDNSLTIERLQRLIGVSADGYAGYNTIVMLQKFLNKQINAGLKVDGECSKKTVKALQTWLNK